LERDEMRAGEGWHGSGTSKGSEARGRMWGEWERPRQLLNEKRKEGAAGWASGQEEGGGGAGREELGQAEIREREREFLFYFSNKFSKPFSI